MGQPGDPKADPVTTDEELRLRSVLLRAPQGAKLHANRPTRRGQFRKSCKQATTLGVGKGVNPMLGLCTTYEELISCRL